MEVKVLPILCFLILCISSNGDSLTDQKYLLEQLTKVIAQHSTKDCGYQSAVKLLISKEQQNILASVQQCMDDQPHRQKQLHLLFEKYKFHMLLLGGKKLDDLKCANVAPDMTSFYQEVKGLTKYETRFLGFLNQVVDDIHTVVKNIIQQPDPFY